MKQLLVLFLCVSLTGFSQETWDDFSGDEKAFFYNISRRIEIVQPELFHLLEFTDSIPYINDTLPNYKYVERQVVKDPSKLLLHTEQMSRKSNGLISDLATHYALWELDAVLKFRNSEEEMHKSLKPKLRLFEKYVLQKIPQTAVQTLTDGNFVVTKAVRGYYEPGLSTSSKMSALMNSGFSLNDQMLILNAISQAEEKYVQIRSYEIFQLLGGTCEDYQNYISAAGDGSGFSSLEGGIFTPYNKKLPDDKGLFRFEVVQRTNKKTEKKYNAVQDVRSREFRTRGDLETLIHFDVYGYHPERQTTVAIQKGGSSYILYGNNNNRLLSPDSTYGEGTTYWRLIWELEHIHIAELNEDLYGKRGYEYWIDIYEKKIEKTLLLIKKTEYKLDQLRHKPEGKPKIKKKKIKKKNLGNSDQSGTGHPTSALSKEDKKTNIEQNRLVHLNSLLDDQKRKLKQLKIEMEEAYFILQEYKTLLDKMQKNLGYLFMEYEQEGDIFTFNDGTTFNYSTQDFTFPVNNQMESFRIFHIAFGKTVFADKIDETFIHMNLSSVDAEDKYVYEKIIGKKADKVAMTESDSIQIMEIFRAMILGKKEVELKVYGGGILGQDGDSYFRDSLMTSEPYSKENDEKRQVWKYRAESGTKLVLSVEVWQDKMLPFNFEEMQSGFDKLKKKNPDLTEIDYTSAIKARLLAHLWIENMKTLVPKWFENVEDQNKVLKKLNKLSVKKVGLVDRKVWAKVPLLISE
jgi:hypothetical protein